MSAEGRADRDFVRALGRASLRKRWSRLRKGTGPDRLLSFDEAKATLSLWSQSYRGMRSVEVEKIVGSVGRYRDFDSSFLPRREDLAAKWKLIDAAYHRGEDLPPVHLRKIEDVYFVLDGNHRVSVARYHNVATIDAEVVELRGQTRAPHGQEAEHGQGQAAYHPQRSHEHVSSQGRDRVR